MSPSSRASEALQAILERPARGQEARVDRARDASEAMTTLLAGERTEDVQAALDAGAEWFAARLRDPSRANSAEAVEHAAAYARATLRALGPSAAEAVLGQLSPARPVAELVDTVELLEEMTEGERAAHIPPTMVPRLATLLAVRREAPILRALGTLIARLAPHAVAPQDVLARLRTLLESALDGDHDDRRDAAFHVLESLGPAVDDLADRLVLELARSPAAGIALGALTPALAHPRIAEALSSPDGAVVFGGLRAVEVAATHDREGAVAVLTDACVRLLHDERPRVGDQALLSLLVLGPPLRSLTIWSTAVVEREAAWLFSLPFRAGHVGDELLEAMYGLLIDAETPRAVQDKIRGLFFGFASMPDPPPRARVYWERLKR